MLVLLSTALPARRGSQRAADRRFRDRIRSPESWTPLFNGRDLSGWYTFLQKHGKNSDPDRVITIEDGAIHLYKHAAEGSTVVMGYIATEKEYGDYHLRFQYRWGTKKFQPRYALKRDAGLYYHIIGPDAVWPRALQYQIQQTDVGDLIGLYGMQLDTWIDPATRDGQGVHLPGLRSRAASRASSAARASATRSGCPATFEVDGWNTDRGDRAGRHHGPSSSTARSSTRGGTSASGLPSPAASPRPLTRGRIALEIEAAEIEFRNVEIRRLEAGPPGGSFGSHRR